MNILILVGIFLVALIAIVAAVLLVMGERETEANAENSSLMNPVAMPATVNDESIRTGAGGEAGRSGRSSTTILLPSQGQDAATGIGASVTKPASVPSPVARTFPSLDRERFPLSEAEAQEEADRSNLGNLDGQFHELSAELRALHARTLEMEQRISMLMEIVDRLDLSIDSES